MKTAIVTVKTEPKVKEQAKKIAEDLGFNLSILINGYMKNLIKTRRIYFEDELWQPSEGLLKSIKEAEEDRKRGDYISFENERDAIAYLKNIIKEEEYES